jgi:hypothetical protein
MKVKFIAHSCVSNKEAPKKSALEKAEPAVVEVRLDYPVSNCTSYVAAALISSALVSLIRSRL